MKQLVKGSAVLTALSLGEMVMRFVRTKCIALLLGPVGTGFFAQWVIFFELLRVFGDLGSRRGVIKQIAEQRQLGRDSERYGEVIKTSYVLALIASGVTGLVVTLFSSSISQALYGTPSHYLLIIYSALLLPIASVSTVTASIVKGNLDYTPFAKYTLVSYFGVMILTPFLIYFMHYWGAVLVQGLFFIFPLIGYIIFNSRSPFIKFSKKLNITALKEQCSYGSIQIYQDSLNHLSKVLIAAWIVKGLGLTAMGMYQVVITFTTVYMAIPIQAMSGYALPLMAGAANLKDVTRAINESMRYLTFLLVPIIVAIMVLPEICIRLFFSADFLPAAAAMQIQLMGTIFLLLAYPFAVALQARGRLKAVMISATVTPLLFLGFSWLLFDLRQLTGFAAAFLIANFANAAIQYYLCRRYFEFHLFPKNKRLLTATLIWTCVAWWAGSKSWEFRIFSLVMGVPWFFFSAKKHEREFLLRKLFGFKDRVGGLFKQISVRSQRS